MSLSLKVKLGDRRLITGRRTMDFETLQKSEALLAKAEEIGQLGSWEHDLITGEDIWSANLCRMVDVDPSKTRVSEQLFWELLHPDDREGVQAVIEWGMKDSQEYEYQARFLLPGGRERVLYTCGKPILGANNKIIKRIGVTQDITQRVESNRALQKSERRYRDLVESSNDLICTHDLDGRVLSMNELPAKLLGYRRDDLIGRRIPELLQARDEFADYIARMKRDGFANGLMVLTTKSGERRIWEYRNTLQSVGDQTWVQGNARDVTVQVEAKRALRASTARLQALVNSIDEIAFEFDVDGTFLDIWTTNESLLFKPRGKLIGRRISDVFEMVPAVNHLAVFRRVMESGEGEDLEYALSLPDGEHWFLCRVTPIVGADGTYKSICMLARDITTRKQTEKSLSLFRALIDRSSDAIDVVDPDTLCLLDVNQKCCEDLGYTREELLTMTIYDIDPSLTTETHQKTLEELKQSGFMTTETMHRRKDGSTFPVEVNLSLVQLDKAYLVGAVRNITDRKVAENTIRKLPGLLLRAQDEERRRIAMEIHEGIGMYVAGLNFTLGKLQTFLDQSNPEQRRTIDEAKEMIQSAVGEIRSVSYLLHPPTLEVLGLESALRWLVKGFVKLSGIKILLNIPRKIERLNRDSELTVFRVTQEALNNVYRHSKSRTAQITFWRECDSVKLEIADNGTGMMAQGTPAHFTLGISGMKERITNLGGTFSIKNGPDGGCIVLATIPVEGRSLIGE
jgi:PAS domain S-box-containing protein